MTHCMQKHIAKTFLNILKATNLHCGMTLATGQALSRSMTCSLRHRVHLSREANAA